MSLKITTGKIRSGLEAWALYREVAAHMKPLGKYDAIKYNWSGIKSNPAKYKDHPAKWTFETIFKNFRRRADVVGYYLANILEGEKWPMGMSAKYYIDWNSRLDRLSYGFKSDLTHLFSIAPCWSDLFHREGSEPSLLFYEFSSGHICLETLVILNRVTGYCSWDSYKYTSNPLDTWPALAEKIVKYQKILEPNIRLDHVNLTLMDLYNNNNTNTQQIQEYVVSHAQSQ